jgi:hypothetical protein
MHGRFLNQNLTDANFFMAHLLLWLVFRIEII